MFDLDFVWTDSDRFKQWTHRDHRLTRLPTPKICVFIQEDVMGREYVISAWISLIDSSFRDFERRSWFPHSDVNKENKMTDKSWQMRNCTINYAYRRLCPIKFNMSTQLCDWTFIFHVDRLGLSCEVREFHSTVESKGCGP